MAPKGSVRERVLSAQTLVPLGSIGVLFGAAFWVASVRADVMQHGKDIDKIEAAQLLHEKEEAPIMREVLDRLARMEEQIKFLVDDAKAKH